MKICSVLIVNFFIVVSLSASSITINLDNAVTNWQLGTDYYAAPTDPGDAVFTITANNIIVDLNNHIISQDSTNTVTGLVGILVSSGVQNAIIRNGTIVGLTGQGIVLQDGCGAVRLENLTISECQQGGVLMNGQSLGVSFARIAHCSINQCNGTQGGPAYGVWATKCIGMIIEDTLIAKNVATTPYDGYGIYIQNSRGIEINATQAVLNGGYTVGVGAYITTSTNCIIDQCFFTGNVSTNVTSTAYAAGVVFNNCTGCRIDKSFILNNTNPFAQAYGVTCSNGIENEILNTAFERNVGGLRAAGIQYANEVRSRTSFCNVYANKAAIVYGIQLTGTNVNCDVSDNAIVSNIATQTSYGISDEANPSTSAFRHNNAFYHTINYNITYPAGITLPIISGSLSNAVPGLPSSVGGLLDNVSITT